MLYEAISTINDHDFRDLIYISIERYSSIERNIILLYFKSNRGISNSNKIEFIEQFVMKKKIDRIDNIINSLSDIYVRNYWNSIKSSLYSINKFRNKIVHGSFTTKCHWTGEDYVYIPVILNQSYWNDVKRSDRDKYVLYYNDLVDFVRTCGYVGACLTSFRVNMGPDYETENLFYPDTFNGEVFDLFPKNGTQHHFMKTWCYKYDKI